MLTQFTFSGGFSFADTANPLYSWILLYGVWRDSGVWVDSASWVD